MGFVELNHGKWGRQCGLPGLRVTHRGARDGPPHAGTHLACLGLWVVTCIHATRASKRRFGEGSHGAETHSCDNSDASTMDDTLVDEDEHLRRRVDCAMVD